MTAARTTSSKPQESSLVDDFLEFFEVNFAVSQEQKNAVFGVRYRVYCEEQKYEPIDHFPDRMERDEFDAKSLHCLITHKSTGIHAGCVRLVGTGGRRTSDLLPYEKHCPESVAPDFFSTHGLRRETICEISRLAVDRRFRRQRSIPAAGEQVETLFSDAEIRTFPLIATAGFLAATALTDITRRTEVFSLMEPFLPRLMRQAGFAFQRAGQDVDYHGNRAAYFCKTEWAVSKLRPELRALYDAIHTRIDRAYLVTDDWAMLDESAARTSDRNTHQGAAGAGGRNSRGSAQVA